jgi:heavy metal sensor kinase
MSLTNRLLVFLLSLLAIVLLGFSLGVYLLVSHYLGVEADERLQSAMNTLVGSLDIEPDTVEWEPADRDLSLPHGPLGEDVEWLIADIDGHILDASSTPKSQDFAGEVTPALRIGSSRFVRHGDAWDYELRHVRATNISERDLHRQRTAEEIEKGEYPSLFVAAGISQSEIRQAVNTLLITLLSLGLILWGLCFAVGRWICRRALRPVTRMAEAAMTMNSRDLNQRLPPVPSGDELATMNRAFNQLLARLQTSFEQQRRFTGDVSHQLRTPLTIIQGQAEVALRRQRTGEEYEDVLRTIRHQVVRLNNLVENLLFLARADSESALPALKAINLNEWLSDFEQTWDSAFPNSQVRFKRATDRHSLVVDARPEMLAEIARNLLDNAIKYGPANSPIEMGLIEADGTAGFSVKDHGRGIAASDIDQVFEPFFRAASAQRSNAEGIGLGLSIANRLATAMNGKIQIESQPDVGSTFSVWLRRCGT